MLLRFILTSFCLWSFAYGQQLIKTQSTPLPGSGPYSSSPDAFSFNGNPAALVNYKEKLIGVFSERKYMMEENSIYALSFGMPTKKGNFGLNINYSGFKDFNEYETGIAYAKDLKNVAVGLQLNYSSSNISHYGKTNSISATLGVLFLINSKFYTGVQATRIMSGSFNKRREAASVRLGFGYQPSTSFFLSMDISKEDYLPGNVFLQIRYTYISRFHAGLSFNTRSVTVSGFAGVSWNDYRIDISAGYHQYLGFTPGLTFFTKI